MAVVVKDTTAQVQIKVNTGTDESPKYKKINIGGWTIDHTKVDFDTGDGADLMYNLGSKVANCQTHPLQDVIVSKRVYLGEE